MHGKIARVPVSPILTDSCYKSFTKPNDGCLKLMKYRLYKSVLLFILFSFISVFFNQNVLGVEYAHIQIKCEPGIKVFLDGIFKGISNSDLEGFIIQDVPAGRHILKIVKQGYHPQEREIELLPRQIYVVDISKLDPKVRIYEKGNKEKISTELMTGRLVIKSLPVEIKISIPSLRIDALQKTKNEQIIDNIPLGSYKALFSGFGKTVEFTVNLISIFRENIYHRLWEEKEKQLMKKMAIKTEIELMVNLLKGTVLEKKRWIFGPFVLNPDRTILDRNTNLVWFITGCWIGEVLNSSDSRVPQEKELKSLYSSLGSLESKKDRRIPPFIWGRKNMEETEKYLYLATTEKLGDFEWQGGKMTDFYWYAIDFKTGEKTYAEPGSWVHQNIRRYLTIPVIKTGQN